MIGCLRTRVRKQPIIALYFESETVLQSKEPDHQMATLSTSADMTKICRKEFKFKTFKFFTKRHTQSNFLRFLD